MFRIFCLFFLFAISAFSLNKTQKLSVIMDSLPNSTQISAQVYDVSKNRVVYHKNANVLMTAASSVKLFTSFAALQKLGKNFAFYTTISATKKIKNGVLFGDVWLEFVGDPSFSVARLEELIIALKKRGVKSINGNIYLLGDTMIDSSYGPGWMWDEFDHCYAAPISDFILDENCFSVRLSSLDNQQTLAALSAAVNLENQVTYSKKCIPAVKIKFKGNNSYKLTGCINSKKWADNFAIRSTRDLLQASIRKAVDDNGLKLFGKIIFTNHKPNDNIVWSFFVQSKPLSKLIKAVLKDSNNVYASSLFLRLRKNKGFGGSSWFNSQLYLARIFKKQGIGNVKVVDGSGLSRYNKLSAAQLVSLLKKARKTPGFIGSFLSALSIVGKDGTLKYAKIKLPNNISIVGKTGSMNGVDVVAGYLLDHNKIKLIYALMLSGASSDKAIRAKARNKWFSRLAVFIV